MVFFHYPLSIIHYPLTRVNYQITTAATDSPLTLAYVKEHVKIDYTDEDTVLQGYLDAAIEYAEKYTERGIMTQTVTQVYDDWPAAVGCNIELALAPLQDVTNVKYYDSDNAQQILATTVWDHTVRSTPALVYLKPEQSWPSVADRPEAVEVVYTVGYADADSVPKLIKQAICLLFAGFETKREDSIKKHKTAAEVLLDNYWNAHA